MTIDIDSFETKGYIEPLDVEFNPITISGSGGAIDLGGGLFLTAAHLVSAVETLPADFYPPASGVGFYDTYSWSVNGTAVTVPIFDSGYNAGNFYANIQSNQNYSYPGHDLALISGSANLSSAPSDLSPMVVFLDQDAASAYLSNHTISAVGPVTSGGVSGSFNQVEGDGQFSADLGLQKGDSGGAAYVRDFNTGDDYIVGVNSISNGGAGGSFTMFSYVDNDFYTTINNKLNAAGFTAGAVDPDLIVGKDANEYVRGSVRKADIITNGDNDVILAGSGGGLINTGVGQNDIVFLPEANGQTDPELLRCSMQAFGLSHTLTKA